MLDEGFDASFQRCRFGIVSQIVFAAQVVRAVGAGRAPLVEEEQAVAADGLESAVVGEGEAPFGGLFAEEVAPESEVRLAVAHESEQRGHEVDLRDGLVAAAAQCAVGGVQQADDVVVAGEDARGVREFFTRYMIGHEYKNRATEPLLAVANATRLLALSEQVLKLVEDGTLSAGHARALLPLSDPEMQLAAAKTVIEKGLSVRRAEALAAQLLKETQGKAAAKPAGVDYLGECARHLEQVLGRKVRMTQGRKTGRIELEYYDADDREALLQALEGIGRRN